MNKRVRATICPVCGGTVLAPETLAAHRKQPDHPQTPSGIARIGRHVRSDGSHDASYEDTLRWVLAIEREAIAIGGLFREGADAQIQISEAINALPHDG